MFKKYLDNQLHLPDLHIQGFRGIKQLSIPRLGRVTLLAGRNGAGKTTVLDAVKAYAARGRYSALHEILESREEFSFDVDEDNDRIAMPNVEALFHGREASSESCITIGPNGTTDQLRIELASLDNEGNVTSSVLSPTLWDNATIRAIKTTFRDTKQIVPVLFPFTREPRLYSFARERRLYQRRLSLSNDSETPLEIKCESLGPGLLNNYDLARFWDSVVLTGDESWAVQALGLIFGDDVERVAVIGDDTPRARQSGRRAVVKLKNHDRPVPLKSLGDGASRMFGVALALANSRNGFLLLDEVENGIHYSVQSDFWRMVLQTAHTNNVQVLATTHSWDCVRGFARATMELEEVEGILFRLEKYDEGTRAVDYSEADLAIAARQGIEVR